MMQQCLKSFKFREVPDIHFFADQYHLEIAPGTWDRDAMSIVGALRNLKSP
jgi:hypothetical protein